MKKKIIMVVMAFMVSLPLTAQNSNSNINVSISPAINSDLQQILLNRLMQEPSQIFCDDVNDTASGCDWSTIQWNNFIDYDTLPDFPDCPIVVLYRVRICPNNPLIRQIEILNIMINLGDYPNCDSLYNYLYSGTPEEISIKAQELKENLYLSISQHESEQMGDLPPCDSLGNYLQQTVFYVEPACKAKIILILEYHSYISQPIIEDVVCNSEALCCKTYISFCKDSLGNPQQQISKEVIGTGCVGYPVEADYETILNKYSDAVVIHYELLPCINVCE